jgi:DNA-binding NarL/FixJ family response regulator
VSEKFVSGAGLLLGADDYVVKPLDPEDLLARARRGLARSRRPASPRPDGWRLTPREREVLTLLADGLSQHQIADRRFISAGTVGTRIQRVLGKLGVHSRTQAVALVHRRSLRSALPPGPVPQASGL